MNFPNINCKVQIFSMINPSEDPEKIKIAISNILPQSNIENDEFAMSAQSSRLDSLEKIYEATKSTQSQGVFRRQLESHMKDDTTWFYLNKQAAFVNRVILCDDSEESPLGPLKVVLTSRKINQVIQFLVRDN